MNRLIEGTVRIGPIMAAIDVLRSMKVDPEELLQEVGIDPSMFDDPDNILPFSSRARMLAVGREKTNCSHFGLSVGECVGLAEFGLVGYLSMHASSVEEALKGLIRYLHLHGRGASLALERKGNLCFYIYDIQQPLVEGADQLEDAALAGMYNVLRELCGVGWGPTEIWFTHRKPPALGAFQKHFQAPLRFNMPRAGIYFSDRWLKRSVAAADPKLHRLLQKQIDELEIRYHEDFPEQVRRVLRSNLLTRHASAEEVAAMFSIHSRTLHRRLKLEGFTFRDLVEDCRYTLARQLLSSSHTSLVRIAEILGYADARAFNRAFKRWSGVTPSRWRKSGPSTPS